MPLLVSVVVLGVAVSEVQRQYDLLLADASNCILLAHS